MISMNCKLLSFRLVIIMLLSTFTLLLAQEDEIFIDELANGSKIHQQSAGWKYNSGTHDAEREDAGYGSAAPNRTGDQYIIYNKDNITDFQIEFRIHSDRRVLGLPTIKMHISSDGEAYEEIAFLLSNRTYRLGSWQKIILTNMNTFPEGTNYLKLSVLKYPANVTFDPFSFRKVKLRLNNKRYTKFTDDFADSAATSYSDNWWWRVSDTPEKWDNDSTLLQRRNTNEQYIIYNRPEIGFFDCVLYIDINHYYPEKIKIFSSKDGTSYSPVAINNMSKGLQQDYGRYIFRPRTLLPEGTNYIKLVVEEDLGNRASIWLSSLSLLYNYQRGAEKMTDPCSDFNETFSHSSGWSANKTTVDHNTELTIGRFQRSSNSTQNLVYKFDDLENFKVTSYWHADAYSPSTIVFYASPDNQNYTEIPSKGTQIVHTTTTNPRRPKVEYQPTDAIPLGTKYLKVEAKKLSGSVASNRLPTISEISLSQTTTFLNEDDFGIYDIYGGPGDVVAINDADKASAPEGFSLEQNYPNPFNPTTSIKYTIPYKAHVRLDVFNVLGQRIRTLVNGTGSLGENIATWNGLNNNGVAVNSGVYYYRISITSNNQKYVLQKKMLVLK